MAREPVQFTCCGWDEMSPESQKAVKELVEVVAAGGPSPLTKEERAQYAEARRSIVEARHALPSTPTPPADQQEGEHRGS